VKRVAIMGAGLMGGSLGLALKAHGFGGTITAYARRAETRADVLARGAADEVCADPAEAVRAADLIVYCTPILTIPDLVAASRPGLKAGAILTDVGSTKQELTARVEPLVQGSGTVFVGSHPVAGAEQQGIEAARADLYDGALVVVTAETGGGAREQAVLQLVAFWEGVGAHVIRTSAREHDRLMARTSHLPHLAASLLARTVNRDGEPERVGPFCGTGFRDTSRVAAGAPEIWRDIVCTNAQPIAGELKALRTEIDQVLAWVEAGDFEQTTRFLEASRASRRALMAHSPAEE
jgi:prephenate dehydrogenase